MSRVLSPRRADSGMLWRALAPTAAVAGLLIAGAAIARGDMLSLALIGVALTAIVTPLFTRVGHRWILAWVVLSVVAFPLVRFPRSETLITFDRLWLGALVVAAVFGARRQGGARAVTLVLRWLAVFCAVFALRAIFHPDPLSAFALWGDAIVLPLVAFYVAVREFKTPERCARLGGALAIAGVLMAIIGIGQRVLGFDLASLSGSVERFDSSLGAVRISGPYPVPEMLGMGLLVTLGGTIYWALYRKGGALFVGGAAVLLQLAAIALTFFRAAWIGAILVLLFGLGLRPRRFVRTLATVGVVGMVLFLVYGGLQQSQVYSARVNNTENVTGRLATYQVGLNLFRSAPLTGVGIDRFLEAQNRTAAVSIGGVRSVPSPHSSFVSILAEQGLVGFVPFMLFVVGLAGLLRRFRRSARTRHDVLLASVAVGVALGVLVMSATLTMWTYGHTTAFFFILMGAAAGRADGIREEAEIAAGDGSARLALRGGG